MDAVLRATGVYLVLLVIFRLSGKRTLAQITTFDFVLLLIISEAAQQALLGDDFSTTNAALVILTLVALDRVLDLASFRSPRLNRLVNDRALLLLEHGVANADRLRMLRLTEADILEQARQSQGIERLDQIKYAVLERNGRISVVPEGG